MEQAFELTDSEDSECSPSGPECCFLLPLAPVGGRGEKMRMMSSSYLLERSTFQTGDLIKGYVTEYICICVTGRALLKIER